MEIDKIKNQVQYRTISLNREMIDKDKRTLQLSFASESPVERFFGYEILSIDKSAMRLGRLNNGGALLLNHNMDEQIGVIEMADCDEENKKAIATVRFSKSEDAEEIYQDVLDGIRTNVSVGYMIHNIVLEKKEGEQSYYRATDWEPYEISIVSVPADITVGVGRAIDEQLNNLKQEILDLKTKSEINLINNKSMEIKMENEPKEKTPQEILAEERTRVAEITALAKRHNLNSEDAIKNGTSIEAYRGIVLQAIGDNKPLDKDPNQLDLNEKEKKDYSFLRLLRTQIPGDKLYGAKTFETELSEQLSKNLGEKPKGAYVPYDALSKTRMKRDLTAGGTATGAEWVSKVWYGSEFIELLRNKMVLQKYGAQVWSGLTGNVYVPKLSVGATYGWRSTETGNTSESTPTTAQLSLTPKSGGTYVDLSKALLLQGNPDVESTITNDIIKACAIGLDTAGLVGSGASGQPTGISLTSGIGSFNGAGIAFTDLIEALTDVESANADVPNMAFLTTPTVRGVLKGRPKEAGAFSGYLCGENNIALGYPCDITNSITAGYLFFGDYSQVIIATWGGIDVLVDPYGSLAIAGLVRVHVDQYADIGIRQAGAFSLATGVS